MQPITSERIGMILAIIVIGTTLFFSGPPTRTVGDNVVLPTKTNFDAVSKKDQADATLYLFAEKDIKAGSSLNIDILDGVLSESKDQAAARKEFGIEAEVTKNRAMLNPAWHFPFTDFGTFAGYAPDRDSEESDIDDGLVIGLRFSPVRVLYDTVAADFLISPSTAGVGVSVYPPSDYFGSVFSHWGVGYGHLWATDNGNSSNIFYLSFTVYEF